jgi:acetyl esterase/lipase
MFGVSIFREGSRSVLVVCVFSPEWINGADSLPDRIILYLRGGAFMFRWPGIYTSMVARWCSRLKARALMVDYPPSHYKGWT